MSTRASLLLNPTSTPIEAGEAVSWIPLLWLSLLSADALEELEDWCAVVDAPEATQRSAGAVPFLADLFPEFMTIHDVASDFVRLLERAKAETLGIDFGDHLTERFLPALKVAVDAIESRKPKASFTIPARTTAEPFTNKVVKLKAEKLKTTRDVVCLVTSMDPLMEDEEMERDQLIGFLFLEKYSQKKLPKWTKETRNAKRVNYRNKKCPQCGKPLRTNTAKQCFACGANWH